MKTKIIAATGFGSDIESALRNAAQNALTEAVGSFVDSEQRVEKNTVIVNEIRRETKDVSSSVREYSQGSIERYNVLSSSRDGAMFRVVADVTVRIEDFQAYLKRAIEGGTAIQKGLFAGIATEEQQHGDASNIFLQRFVVPLEGSSGLRLDVSPPTRAVAANVECRLSYQPVKQSAACDPAFAAWFNQHSADAARMIVFHVEVSTEREFYNSLASVARSVADNDCPRFTHERLFSEDDLRNGMVRHYGQHAYNGNVGEQNDVRYVAVALVEGGSPYFDVCLVRVTNGDRLGSLIHKLAEPKIELSLLGANDQLIDKMTAEPMQFAKPDDNLATLDFHPWVAISSQASFYNVVLPKRQSFDLIADLPQSIIMAGAERATVKLVY